MEDKLVSIIIPCYNLSGYLEACLDSCILQTYKNIEIITVNDGSNDNTQEIIEYYARLDSRIIAIHQKNQGAAKARETGVENSKGDYIVFVDGDDYISLDAIEVLLRELIESNADIAFANYYEELHSGFELITITDGGIITGREFIKRVLKDRIFTIWGKIYKKELFLSSLDYYTDLMRGEDAVLLVQLAYNAKFVKEINKSLYYYRLKETSATKSQYVKNLLCAFRARFVIEEYLLERGFNKEQDYELGIFICFILVAMLLNTHKYDFDNFWKQLIKEKTRIYLFENKEFEIYYRQNFNKNYWRLKLNYLFSLKNDRMFERIYKIIKNANRN
ncbi:MAG: glycosyltransferase [Marinilabiliaceae bacterium]|nr:glycosyltransferase [Marinilabiliaceae bacterium]